MDPDVGLVDDGERRQQWRWLRVIGPAELALVAGFDVLLYVSVQAGPEVRLQNALLGFQLAVVSGQCCSMRLFENGSSHVRRRIDDHSVSFTRSSKSSPEKSVFDEAVAFVQFHKAVQVTVLVWNPARHQVVVQGDELGILLLAFLQILVAEADGVHHVPGEEVRGHFGALLVDRLKVELQHGFLESI